MTLNQIFINWVYKLRRTDILCVLRKTRKSFEILTYCESNTKSPINKYHIVNAQYQGISRIG